MVLSSPRLSHSCSFVSFVWVKWVCQRERVCVEVCVGSTCVWVRFNVLHSYIVSVCVRERYCVFAVVREGTVREREKEYERVRKIMREWERVWERERKSMSERVRVWKRKKEYERVRKIMREWESVWERERKSMSERVRVWERKRDRVWDRDNRALEHGLSLMLMSPLTHEPNYTKAL